MLELALAPVPRKTSSPVGIPGTWAAAANSQKNIDLNCTQFTCNNLQINSTYTIQHSCGPMSWNMTFVQIKAGTKFVLCAVFLHIS